MRGCALLVWAACAALAAFAVWVHFPGHVSMDSSMQLYEASLGRSVTWNPPTMTAVLRWLGQGPDAVWRLMAINVVVTYASLAAAGVALLRDLPHWPWLRAAAIGLILANPVILMFVGVVWKDILFSALITAGAAAGLIACALNGARSFALALLSAGLLAFAMGVRQQGIFMAPVLLLVPMLAVGWRGGLTRAACAMRAAAIVASFLLVSLGIEWGVTRTIQTDPELGSQVGFRGLMQYDIAGMTALSKTPTSEFPLPMTERVRAEVRRVYSPYRGDFLWDSPTVTQWLSLPGYAGIRRDWKAMVQAEPEAYLRHRWQVFRAILNVDGVRSCLPVHVGIDGARDLLQQIGFVTGLDRHDRAIYAFANRIMHWPIYRHWVYLLALLLVTGLLAISKLEGRMKCASLLVATATGLLYASYLPTSIACDFRYLFPATCLVSLLWIVYLARGAGAGLHLRNAKPASAEAVPGTPP